MSNRNPFAKSRVKTYKYTLTLWEDMPVEEVRACLNGWLDSACVSLVRNDDGTYLMTLNDYTYPRKLVDRMDKPLWRILHTINDENINDHSASGYEGSLYFVHRDGNVLDIEHSQCTWYKPVEEEFAQ